MLKNSKYPQHSSLEVIEKDVEKMWLDWGRIHLPPEGGRVLLQPTKITTKEILHYPRLDTVLMVEEFIRENSGEFKKRSLWEHLPRGMMYQTFQVVFDYLEESGKIARDCERKVCWIWNPELVKKYLANESLVVR